MRQTVFVGIRLCRIDQHDAVQLARQVVEHDHRVGDHQQDVRRTQRIGVRALRQLALDVTHAVVAEIAHQPAVEARQPLDRRHAVALLEGLDEGQRVVDLRILGFDTVGGDADAVIVHPQHGAARQADDGIAPPLLTALDGFEQVGIGRVGQLQVQR